jgi:hypothetical protein
LGDTVDDWTYHRLLRVRGSVRETCLAVADDVPVELDTEHLSQLVEVGVIIGVTAVLADEQETAPSLDELLDREDLVLLELLGRDGDDENLAACKVLVANAVHDDIEPASKELEDASKGGVVLLCEGQHPHDLPVRVIEHDLDAEILHHRVEEGK